MKTVSLVLLFLIISASCDIISNSRNYTIGFLSEIEGKDIILNKDCLDGKAKSEEKQIISALKKLNIPQAIFLIRQLIIEQSQYCPMAQFKKIQQDLVKALLDGSLINNAKQNLPEIINIARGIKTNPPQNSLEWGKITGKVINLVVYNKAKVSLLRYLRAKHQGRVQLNFNLTFINNLVQGIVIGASDVWEMNNQCKGKIVAEWDTFKNNIIKLVNDLLDVSIANIPIDVAQFILDLGFNKSESVCHVNELRSKLTNKIQRIRALVVIIKNWTEFKDLVTAAVQAILKADFLTTGENIGKILKLTFDWHTQ